MPDLLHLRLAWLRLRAVALACIGNHPVAWLIATGQWAALDSLTED